MQFQKRIEIAYNYSGIIPFITGPHTTPHVHFKSPATVLSCAMCGKTHYCSVHYFHHFSPVISQWVFQISYQMIYQPLEDSGVWQSDTVELYKLRGPLMGNVHDTKEQYQFCQNLENQSTTWKNKCTYERASITALEFSCLPCRHNILIPFSIKQHLLLLSSGVLD